MNIFSWQEHVSRLKQITPNFQQALISELVQGKHTTHNENIYSLSKNHHHAAQLFAETALHLEGQWQEILNRAEKEKIFSFSPSQFADVFYKERLFLAGLAALRLHRFQDVNSYWRPLLQDESVYGSKTIFLKLKVEKAIHKANKGLFLESIQDFEGAILPSLVDSVDLSTRCRALNGYASALSALGQSQQLQNILQTESRLLKESAGPLFLKLNHLRVEALCAFRCEQFDKAQLNVRQGLENSSSASFPFFLQLKLWLQLESNELEQADLTLQRLQESIRHLGLSPTVINAKPDWCELLLRRNKVNAMHDVIDELAEAAVSSQSLYSQFRSQLFLARFYAHQGYQYEACRAFEFANKIAAEQKYGRDQILSNFHGGGILKKYKNNKQSRALISYAHHIASQLQLSLSQKYLSYIMHSQQNHLSRHLVSLMENHQLAKMSSSYLNQYPFFEKNRFKLSSQGGSFGVSEKQMREHLLKYEGLYWFHDIKSAYLRAKSGLYRVEVERSDSFQKFLDILFVYQGSFQIETFINAIGTRYQSRQKEIFKMFIQMFNDHFSMHGFKIEMTRERGVYVLKKKLALYSVAPLHFGKKTSGERVLDQALHLLQLSQTPLSTQQIQRSLGVSRQALHTALKTLEQKMVVTKVKKGREFFWEKV